VDVANLAAVVAVDVANTAAAVVAVAVAAVVVVTKSRRFTQAGSG
jgi:hypothetical protein